MLFEGSETNHLVLLAKYIVLRHIVRERCRHLNEAFDASIICCAVSIYGDERFRREIQTIKDENVMAAACYRYVYQKLHSKCHITRKCTVSSMFQREVLLLLAWMITTSEVADWAIAQNGSRPWSLKTAVVSFHSPELRREKREREQFHRAFRSVMKRAITKEKKDELEQFLFYKEK